MPNFPFRDPEFQLLLKTYQDSIPQKLEEIDHLIKKMQSSFDLQTLKELKFLVHKLAGSAGTYGYTEVSDICKELENDLNKKLNSDLIHSPPAIEWTASLSATFLNIKNGFKHYGK